MWHHVGFFIETQHRPKLRPWYCHSDKIKNWSRPSLGVTLRRSLETGDVCTEEWQTILAPANLLCKTASADNFIMFTLRAEGIEGFIEDQAFYLSYDLAPPPPPPSLMSASCLSISVSLCVAADRSYWRERRGRSQNIWRLDSLVLYKSYNTLWLRVKAIK